MASRRPNWSRTLPRPIIIPDVLDIATLADVKTLLDHLPPDRRAKATWQHVERKLSDAAHHGIATVEVSVPLQMALTMEGVRWGVNAKKARDPAEAEPRASFTHGRKCPKVGAVTARAATS